MNTSTGLPFIYSQSPNCTCGVYHFSVAFSTIRSARSATSNALDELEALRCCCRWPPRRRGLLARSRPPPGLRYCECSVCSMLRICIMSMTAFMGQSIICTYMYEHVMHVTCKKINIYLYLYKFANKPTCPCGVAVFIHSIHQHVSPIYLHQLFQYLSFYLMLHASLFLAYQKKLQILSNLSTY